MTLELESDPQHATCGNLVAVARGWVGATKISATQAAVRNERARASLFMARRSRSVERESGRDRRWSLLAVRGSKRSPSERLVHLNQSDGSRPSPPVTHQPTRE